MNETLIPIEQPDRISVGSRAAVSPGTRASGRHVTLHICVPSRHSFTGETVMFLIHAPIVCSRVDVLHYRYWFAMRLPVDQARESCAERALKWAKANPEDDHWVLWVDDDMCPDLGAFGALYNEMQAHPEFGALSGFYSQRNKMDPGFIYSPDDNHVMLPGKDFAAGKIVETGWTAMGFLVHRMEVLEKTPRPWFKCHDDMKNAGEDNYFTKKIREHGFASYVHTGVLIDHVERETGERFRPYMPAEVHANGKAADGLVCAFLTCGMPHLADAMVSQLRGTNLVCLDNGGDPPYAGREGVVVIRNRENRYFSGGFNDLMNDIIRSNPRCEAVWLCNDDITGASPDIAAELFAKLKETGAALISPAVVGSDYSMLRPYDALGLVSVDYVDFVCPMISVRAWKDVGGLDEQFVGWFADIDWCKRALSKGHSLIVDYTQRVSHIAQHQTCNEKGTMELHSGGKEAEERFRAKWGCGPWDVTAAATETWAKATRNGTWNGLEVAS
jgi:hypothetical protein